MINQKLIVAVDHGNRNTKTNDTFFTSGLIESDCKPVMGGISVLQWTLLHAVRPKDSVYER